MKMISRSEKTVLMILAGLGALYWGYGLLLLLVVPGDHNYYSDRSSWVLAVIESVAGAGIFLAFGAIVLRNRFRQRRQAWPLFVGVVAGSVLFQYIYFAAFGPLS